MSFKDEEIMLYVDGQLNAKLSKKIKQAAENDKSLRKKIESFQLANTAMLLYADENETVPLKSTAEISKINLVTSPQKISDDKTFFSSVTSFIDNIFNKNFNLFGPGFAAAAVACFGFIGIQTPSYVQNNIARDFYASFSNTSKEATEATQTAEKELIMANASDYFKNRTNIITRGPKLLTDINSSIFINPRVEIPSKDIIINIDEFIAGDEFAESINSHVRALSKDQVVDTDKASGEIIIKLQTREGLSVEALPNNGIVAIGSMMTIFFQSDVKGKLAMLYVDANNKKTQIFDNLQVPIGKGEIRKIGVSKIEEPLGKEYVQFFLENENISLITTDIFNFTVIDNQENPYSNAYNSFEKISEGFNSDKKLKIGGVAIDHNDLVVNTFGEIQQSAPQIKPTTYISKTEGRFSVDLNGDKFPDMIFVDIDNDGQHDYISVDRNNNQKLDALIEINSGAQKNLTFIWYLDDDENGVPDKIAHDTDGNWEIDHIYPL